MGLFDFAKKLVDPGGFIFKSDSQKLAEKQYKTEKDIAVANLLEQQKWNQKNYDEQVRINNFNIAQQQAAFDYQRDLNAMQMQREDTAIQRRVADLEASGLSPTLAAGGAASSTPVHAANAPQGVAPQGVAPQMATPSDIRVQEAMFREGLVKDRMALAMSLLSNMADVSRTKAETEFIKAQQEHQDIVNKFEEDRLSTSIEGSRLENDAKRMANSFNQLANPARLIEMRQAIDLAKTKIDISQLDKEIKTNEKLRQIYYNSEAKFKAALAGKEVELADFKKENIDWDTALKIYSFEYARDRGVPLSGNLSTFGAVADAAAHLRHFFFGK